MSEVKRRGQHSKTFHVKVFFHQTLKVCFFLSLSFSGIFFSAVFAGLWSFVTFYDWKSSQAKKKSKKKGTAVFLSPDILRLEQLSVDILKHFLVQRGDKSVLKQQINESTLSQPDVLV